MLLVDSHCHLDCLDLAEFDGQLTTVLTRAQEQGVSHFLSVNVDLANFPQVLQQAIPYPYIDVSLGMHPTERPEQRVTQAELIALGQHPKVVAIGETGLDYYRLEGDKMLQQERFIEHIRAAVALQKPLIIHTRDAASDTLSFLKQEGASAIGGVIHCFTESWEFAEQALALNFYISFSGIVTFKNAKALQAVAEKIPLDRLLIETDSPYLAPVPMRGKQNQPAYVRYVAEFIAKLRGVTLAEIADLTTANFFRLFHQH